MTKAWDQARVASERQLPSPRRMSAPVGVSSAELVQRMGFDDRDPKSLDGDEWRLSRIGLVYASGGRCVNDWLDICCQVCGCHVCGCEQKEAAR